MKIAPLYDVKNRLSELVKETESGPIVITKNGKPCAALVHLAEDEDMETFMLSHSPRFLDLIDRAAEKTRHEGATPLSALVKELPTPRTLELTLRQPSMFRTSVIRYRCIVALIRCLISSASGNRCVFNLENANCPSMATSNRPPPEGTSCKDSICCPKSLSRASARPTAWGR